MPIGEKRKSVARKLAHAHYAIEAGIRTIIRLREDGEDNDVKPIKLLEINSDTTADGIRPVFFGADPSMGIMFPSVIIEVTPAEYESIKSNTLNLPNGWRLGEEIKRSPNKAAS